MPRPPVTLKPKIQVWHVLYCWLQHNHISNQSRFSWGLEVIEQIYCAVRCNLLLHMGLLSDCTVILRNVSDQGHHVGIAIWLHWLQAFIGKQTFPNHRWYSDANWGIIGWMVSIDIFIRLMHPIKFFPSLSINVAPKCHFPFNFQIKILILECWWPSFFIFFIWKGILQGSLL